MLAFPNPELPFSSSFFSRCLYRLESLYELPLYLVFGGLCGVVSASFSFSARVAGDAFDELKEGKSPITAALLPSIGGLTTGVLALGYPEILYQVCNMLVLSVLRKPFQLQTALMSESIFLNGNCFAGF